MDTPLVSVIILTYNQENYIRQCIDSVLSQKTDYPIEVIVGEDMGTDKTREICKQYTITDKRVLLPDRKENLGVTRNWISCVRQARGKYIMSLGGDDYWHNQEKIQIQADFMEAHPECVICFTDSDILYINTGKRVRSVMHAKKMSPLEGRIQRKDALGGRVYIPAGTMCIRRDMIEKHLPYDVYEKENFPCEDVPTVVILCGYGEIRYLPVSTWTYRVGQESLTNLRDYNKIRKYWMSCSNMYRALHELFPKELGPFEDEAFFVSNVNHALLMAAYENNDYESARFFAKSDPRKGLSAKLANNVISFKMYRIWKRIRMSFN